MYQKITLAGNLGKDPEMKFMPDGSAVTTFSMAVSEGYGDSKHTIWFRVSIWGKRAEVANQYLSKGSKVLVDGRLKADKKTGGPAVYKGRDGNFGSSFDVTATDFVFLSGKVESDSPKTVVEDDIEF